MTYDPKNPNQPILKVTPFKIPKGWGYEEVIANEIGDHIKEKGYCLKLLVFDGKNEGSTHFHSVKHETFRILRGNFKLQYIKTETAEEREMNLVEGDIVIIPPNNPHRIICLDKGIIIEGSSPDHPFDSYRVVKGDSQKLSTNQNSSSSGR